MRIVFYLKEKHLLCEEDGECFWLGKGQARGIILLASLFPIYITELALFCCFTAFSALQVGAEGRIVFLASKEDESIEIWYVGMCCPS